MKKILTALLTAILICTAIMPATAFAANSPPSPLGFMVTAGGQVNNVNMIPGTAGEVKGTNDTVAVKWAMDDDGYFTISFEQSGSYTFGFRGLKDNNKDATFGGYLIGAGGGGGGATYGSSWAVGQGGSGGQVIQYGWSPFKSGWKVSEYTTNTIINVGKGGNPGMQFDICACGGDKCPLGGYSSYQAIQQRGNNDGERGGNTSFGSYTAQGGAGGRGGQTTGQFYSGTSASPGQQGQGSGSFAFWGVEYPCGLPGLGGSFGLDDGPGGNATYFHEGNMSYGTIGQSFGGKGNGGGGAALSYTYGHSQMSGTGTGEGKGSYSRTVQGSAAKGGDSPTYNGYVYLQGQVHVTDSGYPKTIERVQLVASVQPTEVNPIPDVEWESTNVSVAKVTPTGTVLVKAGGDATITASVKKFNLQDSYAIHANGGSSKTTITVSVNGTLSKVGDKAQMKAKDGSGKDITSSVYWASSNTNVAVVDKNSGAIEIKANGQATITANMPDASQGAYNVNITG